MGQMTKCAAKPDEHVQFGAGCGFCGHEARVAAAKAKPAARPRAQAVRAKPQPIPLGRIQRNAAIPSPSYPPMMRAPARPLRPRRRVGGWSGMVVVLALAAAVLATQDIWRPMLPGADGSARAADVAEGILPAVPEAPDAKIAAFEEPKDYLILPAGGALSVPLRRGPGDDFPIVERLSMHDAVIGRGTSADADGSQWVWVARASDGLGGFIQRSALMERAEPGALEPLSAPRPDDAEVAAGKSLVEARYKQLLAHAIGYDRAYLTDGQELWKAQRRRCDDDPAPASCRKMLDTQRRGDLEGWREAELMTQRDKARAKLIPASLDTLR
jgi:hypothetical protein